MQDTAIKAGVPAPVVSAQPSGPAAAEPALQKRPRGPLYRALEFCASLRITVVLFVLAFLLVFFGTWAQVDASIWTVVKTYFRWWFVWIPFKVLVFRTIDIPESYGIPFPGGWTLGALLLTNFLAAHAIRFKLSWKRSGILILHLGLIVMMLGEFFTGVFAIEGRMTIMEGTRSNFVESDRHYELAVTQRQGANDEEVLVPASFLRDGKVIADPALPFDVEVVSYMANSDIRGVRNGDKNPATTGVGNHRIARPKSETAGVDTDQSVEFPSAYVALKAKKTGALLGTYLVSTWFTFLGCAPDSVLVDGKKYAISLRPTRSYRDYTIQLDKFQHKKFVGTEVAKDFKSSIHLIEPGKAENRAVDIYMNHPLYYRGETFYQSGVYQLATGTVLQVVDNWAWSLPYWSCGLVAGGMLIHFGIMLVNFIRVQGIGILAKNAPALELVKPASVAKRKN